MFCTTLGQILSHGGYVIMDSARCIVSQLVRRGVIPEEFAEVATEELYRELSRRVKRNALFLASVASRFQLGLRYAESRI